MLRILAERPVDSLQKSLLKDLFQLNRSYPQIKILCRHCFQTHQRFEPPAACAAVATGASLAKLAPEKFPTSITCQFWNEFSRDVGADVGSLGANTAEIANYYGRLGYQCVKARMAYWKPRLRKPTKP
jgi:hypothetical protein